MARKKTTTTTTTKGGKTSPTTLSAALYAAKTPAQKAAATRRFNAYLDQQELAGKDRAQVAAGVKAAISRLTNSR